MSLAVVSSRALLGVEAVDVTVETHLSNGLPGFAIVGLPETAVRESKERVRSAILNSGLSFPERRITVNLAPADLPKAGGQYDLAIAMSILQASGQLPQGSLDKTELMGELALNGELRHVRGAVAAILAARAVGNAIVIPHANHKELKLVHYEKSFVARSLLEYVAHLRTGEALAGVSEQTHSATSQQTSCDTYLDVKGQAQAKRATEIAAAGRHNILFIGPPGCGKTMLAQNLTRLLPPLSKSEALELAAIRSVANMPVPPNIQWQRPLRSPHHCATHVALVGGGNKASPGEVSLAHRGVLFLDEFSEFKPMALDALREPLETGSITVSRASYRISFPAEFQLVAAMNPCPCGNASDPRRECRCTADKVTRYLSKLSGPLLDRIDLLVELPSLTQAELLQTRAVSEEVAQSPWIRARESIKQCHNRQMQRASKLNNALSPNELDKYCALGSGLRKLLAETMDELQLSARAVHRVIKVAQTIADYEGATAIAKPHLLEAISFRRSQCLGRLGKY